MYQALYRKWRPRRFEDVVGQEHITDTLRRQVAEGRLSHAYLFTGTRGTGKTTCAKILAKAVNCEHPVDGDPCNQCSACQGIDNGSLLDVLELDAASNNGVDHVRALREEAIYSPAHVKYRVYIVDEVHMLSTAAFNALLKILEEPPAHLIFILATTELHKVPATILSRCQRFAFKRIQPQDIARRLMYVAREETIALTEDGAELLSRLADGALRDALSLLDQCAAAGGTVDTARILEILGLAGRVETGHMMGHILRRDAQSALLLLHQLYSGGKDVSALLGELAALSRDLLIRMTAPKGGAALLSGGYSAAVMDELAVLASPARLIHITTLLQDTLSDLASSANKRIDGELCLLRLCDDTLCGDLSALAARIERLEKGAVPAGSPVPAAPQPAASTEAAAPASANTAPSVSTPAAPNTPVSVPADDIPWEEPALNPVPVEPDVPWAEPISHTDVAPPAATPTQAPPLEGPSDLWDQLIDAYKSRLPAMYRAFLDGARGTLAGDLLTVVCANDFTRTQLYNVKVQSVLQEITSQRVGRPIAVSFTVGEVPETSARHPAAPSGDKLDDLIQFGSKFDNFTVK